MSVKDNLTEEELLVQADRILEHYKLDLNCSAVVLNHITLAILDTESSIVPQVKEIVDFFNPSMLEWGIDYEDSYHERVIYCDAFLRSDQHCYASFTLEGRYRPSNILTVKIFSKPNQKKFFEFEIDISSKHNRKMGRREIDIELDNVKLKIIEKIKEYGFNLPEITSDNVGSKIIEKMKKYGLLPEVED